MPLPAITEDQFKKQVIDLAHLRGWRVAHFRPARVTRNGRETWRTPVEGDGAGFPDLVLARDGDVIFAELKVGKNTLSDEQSKWLNATDGYCWRPENWPQIEELLK